MCHCGHELRYHLRWNGGPCGYVLNAAGWDWTTCACPDYDDSVLPAPGERPVFGVHHLATRDADWTTASDSDREAAFRKWVKGAPMGEP